MGRFPPKRHMLRNSVRGLIYFCKVEPTCSLLEKKLCLTSLSLENEPYMKAEIITYRSLAQCLFFNQKSWPRTRRESEAPRTRKSSPENGPLKQTPLIRISIGGPKLDPISCPENGPDFGALVSRFWGPCVPILCPIWQRRKST